MSRVSQPYVQHSSPGLPLPKHTSGQAIDIQGTDQLTQPSTQSGFWTLCHKSVWLPWNCGGLGQVPKQPGASRPPSPLHPMEVLAHPDANALKWLKLLSMNGGKALGGGTQAEGHCGHCKTVQEMRGRVSLKASALNC